MLRRTLSRWLYGRSRNAAPLRSHRSFVPGLDVLEDRTVPSTLTVLNNLDNGPGSLRQAILDADSNPGLDTICFRIGTGAQTIHVGNGGFGPLPAVTDPVILDGTTQPGFAGRPLIELDGTAAGVGADGLVITAGASTVRGLVINRFQDNAIVLTTGGGNRIEGNYLGTDTTGTAALGNLRGVVIDGSANNTVGGTTPPSRNLISGNTRIGVAIANPGATGNLIAGNYLGTDVTGTDALGNGRYGIFLDFSDGANTIGGTTVGARNIISGNGSAGVAIAAEIGDVVVGNYIGTDVTGTDALGNIRAGVVSSGCIGIHIGGPGEGNVIAGNQVGIDVVGDTGDVVAGNYIGTDARGRAPLGNTSAGVLLEVGASNNLIGSDTDDRGGNVISANGVAGVLIRDGGTNANAIVHNLIGTDASGTRDLPNGRVGVGIYREAFGNFVGAVLNPDGMTLQPAGNLIAGNDGPGVWLNAGYQVVVFNTIRDNRGAGVAVSDLLTRRGASPRTGYLPGDRAPDFTFKDQNGHDVSLSDFAGKYVILDFCPAWCMPCQQLTQQVPGIIQRLRSLNIPFEYVQVLTEDVNGNPATLADAQAWAQRFQLSSPVLWGPQADALFEDWGGAAFPSLFFLNPDRTLYFEFVGFDPATDLVPLVSAEANGTFTTPYNVYNNLRYNSISDNTRLGIDLGNDGVTANTPGIHPSGPNLWQNYPVLTSVVAAGNNEMVSGYLDSTPNMTFLIQVFANARPDDSGHGQGQYFLGETQVTSDQSGHATFSLTYTPLAGAPFLSATATDYYGYGNTSEFSRTIKVSDDAGQVDIDGEDAQNAALPSRAVAGMPVTTLDANGREALGSTGTVIFSSSDPDAPLPGTLTAADRGVHNLAGPVPPKKGKGVFSVTDSLDPSPFDDPETQLS
jgi:thiol-disulfide isomerase/thioredoxin